MSATTYIEYTHKDRGKNGKHRFAIQGLTREDLLLIVYALRHSDHGLTAKLVDVPISEDGGEDYVKYFQDRLDRNAFLIDLMTAEIDNEPIYEPK